MENKGENSCGTVSTVTANFENQNRMKEKGLIGVSSSRILIPSPNCFQPLESIQEKENGLRDESSEMDGLCGESMERSRACGLELQPHNTSELRRVKLALYFTSKRR